MGNKSSRTTATNHEDDPEGSNNVADHEGEFFFEDNQIPSYVKRVDNWRKQIVKASKDMDQFKQKYPSEFHDKDILGRGTYGDVYKCPDHSSTRDCPSTAGCFVAIKRIRRKKLLSEGQVAIEGLQKEIAILNLLSHPHVLKFRAYFEDNIYHYVITEILHGGELFERICEAKNFTERNAHSIMVTMVDTMAYLYSKGIVHRDIKPENLLLVHRKEKKEHSGFHELQVKLADFGYATQLRGNKPLKTICGTPGYMAPEILSGIATGKGKKYGGKCDVYSLGVVFYVMLSGTLPYDPNEIVSNKVLRYKVIHSPFHFPEKYWHNISPGCVAMVKSMTHPNARKRKNFFQISKSEYLKKNENSVKDHHLPLTQEGIKKYQARKNWKKAFHALAAARKFSYGSSDELVSAKVKPTGADSSNDHEESAKVLIKVEENAIGGDPAANKALAQAAKQMYSVKVMPTS